MYLGSYLFDFVGVCVSVCFSSDGGFSCVVFVCLRYREDCLFAFVSAGGGLSENRSFSQIHPSRENQIEVDGRRRGTGR